MPNISSSDMIAWQASIGSVSMMMTGKWKLIGVSNGWSYSRKPDKPVELILNQAGDGELYEDGILVSKIELRIKRIWGRILFDFEQEGESTTIRAGLFEHGRSPIPNNPKETKGR